MKKIFDKCLAWFISTVLVTTLFVGTNVTKTVKANDSTMKLTPWTFTQGGQYTLNIPEVGIGNDGIISSVTMKDTNEFLTGWLESGFDSINQKMTATQISTGFAIDIKNTGWDAQWDVQPYRINPWSIQAGMNDIAIEKGHIYTVSFKARASKKKYAYVAFSSTIKDSSGNDFLTTPYDQVSIEGSDQIIALSTTEQTFTYTFTNWVAAENFTTTLMLGAFNAQYDYDGNDIFDIVKGTETNWSGTVYVSDFTVTDNGLHPDFEEVTTLAKPDLPQECDHEYKIDVKEPTCTESGYSVYECTKCGEISIKDQKPATGHKYVISTIKPTCEQEGYTLHQCDVCGDTYKDNYTVNPGHVFSRKIVKPTCTEDGYTVYECDYCDESYKDNIVEATGHTYTDTIVKPTTSSQGYTLHTCSQCGDTYKDNYVAKLESITTKPWETTSSKPQQQAIKAVPIPSKVKPTAKNLKKKSIKLTWKKAKNAIK